MQTVTVLGRGSTEGDPDDTDAVISEAQRLAGEDARAKAEELAEGHGLTLEPVIDETKWFQHYNPDHPRLRCTCGKRDEVVRRADQY